jgi:branched-subunit amino acid aminotransferase/4-amino-4-deoxychorismate lyase
MLLPVDDRLATRGHGTFDVVYVKNRNIINLDAHIDRLYASSQTVEIIPPIEKEKAK